MMKPQMSTLPLTWTRSTWPRGVHPNPDKEMTGEERQEVMWKINWLIRAYGDELEAAGALRRIGRNIVILGQPYLMWLHPKPRSTPARTRKAQESAAA